MNLLLILVQRNITSLKEAKDLNKIQQKQLELEFQLYFGKRTSLKTAFNDECIVDFYQIADKSNPDKMLYDFFMVNSDSGGVFITDSTESAGVEMIQGHFGTMRGFTENKEAKALADALDQAEKTKQINPDYIVNEQEEIDDFKSQDFVPTDAKAWLKFLKNNVPSEKFVRKYHSGFNKGCWSQICEKSILSENFLIEFSKKINWDAVSRYQNLSETFIHSYKDKVNWINIALYKKLSEDFIRKHLDKLDWYYICGSQNLSEAFIREFKNQVDWSAVSWGQKLSESFVEEFREQLKWEHMFAYQQFSETFIRKHIDRYDWSCWLALSRNQNMSIDFINEYDQKINWNSLSMNWHLTTEHLETFKDKIDWNIFIGFGKGLSEKQVKQFEAYISNNPEIAKFNWERLLKDSKKFPISKSYKAELIQKYLKS